MFKISLGMIVRNEGRTLRECLLSVAPHVDEIVIGLGGESTDDTEAIAREFTDKIIPLKWEDDFSKARNVVFEAVTGDYFLWLDGDDVLIGGEHLRRLIQQNPNVDAFFAGYDYARDVEGNCICYLVRERLIRLHDQLPQRGWTWVGKVHEVLLPVGDWERHELQVSDFVVQHHKPANKHDPERNLKLLYEQLKEQEPNPDPRILGYLCSENNNRGNLRDAIAYGQRFIQLSGWPEEKYQMQHRVADMYRTLKEYGKAIEADNHAIQIQPAWPDAWIGLAETYTALENWPAVIEMIKAAGTKEPPNTLLIINPLDYTYFPFLLLAAAQAHVGDFESARDNYNRAFEVKPTEALGKQIQLLVNEINLQGIVTAFLKLREQLGRNDEWLKVRRLFDVIPKHVEQHPAIMQAWERTMIQTAHVADPNVMQKFYDDNPHWEPMKEETLLDPTWLKYPRLEFAINTARRLKAKNVVDWGCSDGFIALPLAKELGIHVTGFDIDRRCIDLAQIRTEKWGIDARFEVGSITEIGGWEGDKADLALFFETIEHVVDPVQALQKIELTARNIALTTPYLSWEKGHIPAWDRVEPKGHLRIFDQYDLERILRTRGRIWNLYREPWGDQGQGWLFADYEVGTKTDKTIIIGAMGAPEPWNPRTFRAGGLGGSETAVLKLAESFVRLGHQPIVYSDINEPGYYNGACYRPREHFRPEIQSDLYIAWRDPTAADWDIDTKCLVLWLHDVDAGDRLTKERAKKFNAIVVLSEWHKEYVLKRYPFLKADKLVVIGNGTDPERFKDRKVKRDPKRVIYSSSPDRGLDIILENIWPKVLEVVPEAELHVYYGWNTVDRFLDVLSPEDSSARNLRDFKYKILTAIANTKNVTQHGRVDQETLAEAFLESSVWLYPTYFTETYCITAVEAQLGGAIPITNHLAALEETVRSGIVLSEDVMNPEVQEQYANAVIGALITPLKERQKLHKKVKKYAPAQSWDEVTAKWQKHFLRVEN